MPPIVAATYAHKGWAFAAALAAVVGAVLLVEHGKGAVARLKSVLAGKDNRISTSKTVAAAWTVVVAYVLILLMFNWPSDWDTALTNLSPTYLLLLGVPYAALVLAKAVVASRVASGSLTKPEADVPRLSDLFNDDAGQPDLFDIQYVVFNAIAIVFVIAAVGRAKTDIGFPAIPTGLALLTGGPAAVYVSNKFFGTDGPAIFAVAPRSVEVAQTFTITGQNLTSAGGAVPTVTVGANAATVATATPTLLTVIAPAVDADAGRSLSVSVKTSDATIALLEDAVTITAAPDPAAAVALYGATTGDAKVGDLVRLEGEWPDGNRPIVELDGGVVSLARTTGPGWVAFIVPPLADLATPRTVSVKVRIGSQESNTISLHVGAAAGDATTTQLTNGGAAATPATAAQLRPRAP